MKESYKIVGRLGKSHGLEGEIKLRAEPGYEDTILEAEVIFLSMDDQFVPYFIEWVRQAGSWLLKFEDIDTPEAAKQITGNVLFLPISVLSDADTMSAAVQELTYGFLQNFDLINTDNSIVGRIREVASYPQQEMAVLQIAGSEVLIPLHPDLIVSINEDDKEIIMDLPEGLLPEYSSS